MWLQTGCWFLNCHFQTLPPIIYQVLNLYLPSNPLPTEHEQTKILNSIFLLLSNLNTSQILHSSQINLDVTMTSHFPSWLVSHWVLWLFFWRILKLFFLIYIYYFQIYFLSWMNYSTIFSQSPMSLIHSFYKRPSYSPPHQIQTRVPSFWVPGHFIYRFPYSLISPSSFLT